MDNPVNFLLEIQYGRRNIGSYQKIGLAITFENRIPFEVNNTQRQINTFFHTIMTQGVQ